MKEGTVTVKEGNAKKDFSPTKSDKSIHSARTEPVKQLGSLRDVIDTISRNGGTPSHGSIATELSIMPTAQRASTLLGLQRTQGNRYVQRVVAGIQAKLMVGPPGDKYEQEADRVAKQVVREISTPAVQSIRRQDVKEEEEEELLQGKFETVQRQEIPEEEEEELLQGKFGTVQRQELEEEELLQGKFETVQRQEPEEEEELLQEKFASGLTGILQAKTEASENKTGMPDQLKSGLENLSGMSVDDVKVHYNSSKPQQLNALAYTQGQDIHIAPGQGKHLPHEGWHAVQQMQGRVRPTFHLKGERVNDDRGLEREADLMGGRAAMQRASKSIESGPIDFQGDNTTIQLLQSDVLARQRLKGASKEVNVKDITGNEKLNDLIVKLTAYDEFEWNELSFAPYFEKEQQKPLLRKAYYYLQEIMGLAELVADKNKASLKEDVKKVVEECNKIIDAVKEDIKNLESGEYHFGVEKMQTPQTELKSLAEYAYNERKNIWDKEVKIRKIKKKISAITDPEEQVKKIKKEIYSKYSEFPEGKPLDTSKYKDFIKGLKSIEDKGDSGKKFLVYPQIIDFRKKKRKIQQKGAMKNIVSNYYKKYKKKLDEMFAYRTMAGPDVKKHKEKGGSLSRITLRLNPEKSLEVFKVVAKEIVGSSKSFKHVEQAKIMGPAKIGTSSDSLIIYVKSTDQKVIKEIVDHLTKKFSEDYFVEGGPMTMLKLPEKGFSYAERAEETGSHGASRSLPIARALKEFMESTPNDRFEKFMEKVNKQLEAKKINPEKPWGNK